MSQNPYESSRVATGGWSPSLTSKLSSLRVTVAFLVSVVLFQWVCHFLTAAAMFTYMGAAQVGPTAKTLDSVFYGFCCVGFTALLSLLAGMAGVKVLQRTNVNPEER
jgi:hypothetical protein